MILWTQAIATQAIATDEDATMSESQRVQLSRELMRQVWQTFDAGGG